MQNALSRFQIVFLLLMATLAPDRFAVAATEQAASGSTSAVPCEIRGAAGESLLARRLPAFAVANAPVINVLITLWREHRIPVSFIEADGDPRVTVSLEAPMVRDVLSAIVQQAPAYRFEVVRGRLLLYPNDPKYDVRLEDPDVPESPRVRAAYLLVTKLRKRLPAFADLGSPSILGDPQSYLYQDPVAVAEGGRIVELFVQLLGFRPGAYFTVQKQKWGTPALNLGIVELLQSIAIATPGTSMQKGEVLQLAVTATLVNGATGDVTAAACGTTYFFSDGKVLVVSPDGEVTALAPGKVRVTARNGNQWGSIDLEVGDPPKTPAAQE